MTEGNSLNVENVTEDANQFTIFGVSVTAYVDLWKCHVHVGNMTWSRYIVLTRWPLCDRSMAMSMVWTSMSTLHLCIELKCTFLHTWILLMVPLSSWNGVFQQNCLMWRFFRLFLISSLEEKEENMLKASVRISRVRKGTNVQFVRESYTRELHVLTTTNCKQIWLNLLL